MTATDPRTETITTECDICGGTIAVPRRPYRAKRLCEGCASFDRLRGIEQAARRVADTHQLIDGLPDDAGSRSVALRELRAALSVPEPQGDQ